MGETGRTSRIFTRLAPARFLWFFLILAAAFAAQWQDFADGGWKVSFALAFDAAALVFLLSLVPLFRDRSPVRMRGHARDNDANRLTMLVLTTVVAFAVMMAIGSQLGEVRDAKEWAVAKLVVTMVLIWLFANSVYALHYAHAFYTPDGEWDARGLEFEGEEAPDYYDFAYFAFTIGMTFQTSDVTISSRTLRRVVLLHSFGAFVFNIGVIAFTINALGGA